MNIDQLPPEMLVIILKARKVSLKKYIKLRAVSSHWQAVIEAHVLGKITELEINDGYFKGNRLPVPSTDGHTQLIARLLPAVTCLKIDLDRVCLLNAQLPRLISLYSSKLTRLSLIFVASRDQPDDPLIQAVCDAINSLTKLNVLELRPYTRSSPPMLPSLGPTLARLQQFAYSLEGYFWEFTSDEPLVNLTGLDIDGNPDFKISFVADIVATFPSLQSLLLEQWFGNNLGDILRHLSSLEHLSELKLKISVTKLYYEDEDVYRVAELAEHLMPSPTDRPLTGAKKLELKIVDNEFGEQDIVHAALLSLMVWFPNLTSLSIGYDYDYDGEFELTDAVLGALARLEHLTELKLPCCFWKEQFNGPTGRPLTSVTELYLNFPESDFEVEHFAPLVAWFPQLKDLDISLLSDHHCFLTTAMLRDLSRLEHLTNFRSQGELYIKSDQLSLPSSTDRPLVNVKELILALCSMCDRLDSTEDEDSAGERPVLSEFICEAIVAWFPNLTVLRINVWEFANDKLALTNTMLRQLARLESLTSLFLETLLYKKKHLGLPSSTDRPLTSLKFLKLEIADCPFDVPYFGQTLAAWFPCLKELQIVADKKLKCSIEENRHHFGSSISVTF